MLKRWSREPSEQEFLDCDPPDQDSQDRDPPDQAPPAQYSGRQASPDQGPTESDAVEALGEEIARLSAHIHAATHQLLVLIRAFDEREGWAWGFRSCAEWLSWRTGISPGPAREKVRVARALGDLPLLSEAMARGELSFSKVRALTRVARPETETELLELARHATAAHLERIVRGWRLVDRLKEAEKAEVAEARRHAGRYLRLHPDHDGSWVIRGRLDPEVGALLEKALEWAREALYQREPAAGSKEVTAEEEVLEKETCLEQETSPEQRLADALGLVAEGALSGDGAPCVTRGDGECGEGDQRKPVSRAARFQVVVHVEAAELCHARVSAETPGRGVQAGGTANPVSAETARRVACDADLVEMTHDPGGRVLDVGRKRRTVPPAIRRALDHRDGGCRFPGCSCRYADAHHIVHWADGGETKLENLVLLCRRHHRAVHEEGFRVEAMEGAGGGEEARCLFYRPDGRPFPAVPQAPAVPAGAVAEMVRGHRSRGVDPDAWTATPLWNGEPLDLGLAMDMLRGLDGGA